jgi:hypothetical protein
MKIIAVQSVYNEDYSCSPVIRFTHMLKTFA